MDRPSWSRLARERGEEKTEALIGYRRWLRATSARRQNRSFRHLSSAVERPPCKRMVISSILIGGSFEGETRNEDRGSHRLKAFVGEDLAQEAFRHGDIAAA